MSEKTNLVLAASRRAHANPELQGGGTAAARGSDPQVAVFGEYVVMRRADAQRLLELRHLIIQSAHLIG